VRSVVLAAICAAIVAGGADVQKPSPLPIAPGAEDVRASAGDGIASVEYDVKDPYPSVKTIDFLVAALRERGWSISDLGGHLPPGPPAIELPRTAHRWEARWRDPAGNEIAFTLTSNCPMERYGMHSVYIHVAGVQYGKAEAARREADRQKRAKGRCASLRGLEALVWAKACGP
jgi:hypothetical protein